MRFLPYSYFLILVACAAPSVGVMGGRSETVTVGAYEFDVNYKGARAEAYRANIVWQPKAHEIFAAGKVAMEQVTGCTVVGNSLHGDVGVVQADLIC